jgi:hypothetical protein
VWRGACTHSPNVVIPIDDRCVAHDGRLSGCSPISDDRPGIIFKELIDGKGWIEHPTRPIRIDNDSPIIQTPTNLICVDHDSADPSSPSCSPCHRATNKDHGSSNHCSYRCISIRRIPPVRGIFGIHSSRVHIPDYNRPADNKKPDDHTLHTAEGADDAIIRTFGIRIDEEDHDSSNIAADIPFGRLLFRPICDRGTTIFGSLDDVSPVFGITDASFICEESVQSPISGCSVVLSFISGLFIVITIYGSISGIGKGSTLGPIPFDDDTPNDDARFDDDYRPSHEHRLINGLFSTNDRNVERSNCQITAGTNCNHHQQQTIRQFH